MIKKSEMQWLEMSAVADPSDSRHPPRRASVPSEEPDLYVAFWSFPPFWSKPSLCHRESPEPPKWQAAQVPLGLLSLPVFAACTRREDSLTKS